MNPNQKILCTSATALVIGTIAVLIGIANLGLNIGLHLKPSCNCSHSQPEATNTSQTIINNYYNETNITQISNTNIQMEERASRSFNNLTKGLCTINSWHIYGKDNAIRIGENSDVLVTREPYVSCDPEECRFYALSQGTTIRGKHSNGTIHDRSQYRALISWPLSSPPTVYNSRVECIGWSSTSCHDGKSRMSICISGPNNNASAVVWYNRRPVAEINTWARNILRTQESECVCHNGVCPVVFTDGSATGPADTRIYYFKEGKILKWESLTGTAKHIEECSCYGERTGITCTCRDNWQGSNRPVIQIDPVAMTHTSQYICSPVLTDNPRPNDPNVGKCNDPYPGNNNNGVKGFSYLDGVNTWLGRTISTASRSGYEMLKVPNALTDDRSKPIQGQTIVLNTDWSGYSGSFMDYWAEGDCYRACFYVELIRGRPKEDKVWWTSNSIVSMCSSTEFLGQWNWPDGAKIEYFL
ncbi:neuraminidase [Influenza A virus]|uniref:Neuraminidase n=2 Tax=H15N9 subtype TaxID=173714 RepID=A0A1U9W1R8_9INFA|nr:neuraminidase [Influenza A virus (A/duck/Bangladesh/24704/2015(H15N9))]AQY17983.1 neuraminidase [Influenza A virus (A/duck/Bangladesh/24697/2015(H15N9))]